MSSSELDTLQAAFRAAGGKWSTFIIWAKNTFTLGRSDYQRQYEPILYGWPEGARRHWCGDRDQGDVWQIKKPARNDLHPTMKPVELVERAIRNSSRPGDRVLDPFGGSGTTLIAAEKSGRVARLMELDPRYVDVIVRRWQDWTGKAASREADGVAFDDLAAQREVVDVDSRPQQTLSTFAHCRSGHALSRARCRRISARLDASDAGGGIGHAVAALRGDHRGQALSHLETSHGGVRIIGPTTLLLKA